MSLASLKWKERIEMNWIRSRKNQKRKEKRYKNKIEMNTKEKRESKMIGCTPRYEQRFEHKDKEI